MYPPPPLPPPFSPPLPPHRGTLLSINESKYQAQVRLGEGPGRGKEVWLEYEDVCKLDQEVAGGR